MKNVYSCLKSGALALVVGTGFLGSVDSHAKGFEKPDSFRINANMSFPRASDNWDGGLGLTAQVLFPASFLPEDLVSKYHWALSIGTASWDVSEDTLTGVSSLPAKLTGDIQTTNLGASILRTDSLSSGIEISTEVGLIYSNVSADVRLNYTSAATLNQDVDIDNAFLGLLAVDIKHKVSEDMTIFAGLGYQFDIAKGDASIPTDAVENTFNAFFLRGGINF